MGNYPDKVGPIYYPKQITGQWFSTGSFSNATIPVIVGANQVTVYTREGTLGRDQVFGPGFRTITWACRRTCICRTVCRSSCMAMRSTR